MSSDRSARWSVALLAVLAYVPALASAPGRMPADTKLYLYLDPGGLLGRAASTFEPDQFAGWVPHQQITYLWPSGPWFWLFDALGTPDWIAHRLWIGSIMFAAGAGVRWLARLVDLPVAAAFAAGAVYQATPYVLAYVSRTSLLLLPWAALGWIVALTVRATRVPPGAGRLRRWFDPAALALLVVTVGSANATALALIAPAPVLWLAHVAIARRITVRAALGIAVRTGALCVAVSLWWIAMLSVQARYGAPVLSYSETLADVSRSSTGSEVVRGLGYWLFYVRDAFGPATSASFDYLASARWIAISYAVPLIGLAGLASTSWAERRFAAWLAIVGVVLAVGVHPIGSPSPLMSLLLGDDESGVALALRSSTRAVPMFVLGVALGVGALVERVPLRRIAVGERLAGSSRTAAAIVLAALAVVNVPALWRFELVDPAIDRDADVPEWWTDAAAAAGDRGDGTRVLQLPGAESGGFSWGFTVDQPLVGITDKPLVTRDWLPLGSDAAMDLLYALDDRLQQGALDADAVAPVARLFAADVVWVADDLDALRFRTPSPAVVDAMLTDGTTPGLGSVRRFGPPAGDAAPGLVDAAAVADRAGAGTSGGLQPIALVTVERPQQVLRVKTDVVVVSGSGDGIVDAGAAGLVHGDELIRYSASLSADEFADALEASSRLIITDSNRDRAHHWRNSQDVVGHTEPGGPGIDVLVPTSSDQRLEVFPGGDPAQQTIAIQDGPVTAIASAYGEPFAYRPEDRAVMAIDGDRGTAWLVGDHGDPVGAVIRLTADESADHLVVHQPPPAAGGRLISAITVRAADADIAVELTDASLGDVGQRIEVDVPAGMPVDVRIDAVAGGAASGMHGRSGVGFSELDLGLGPTTEYIRPPVDALRALGAVTETDGDVAVSVVLTRLRVAATDPWRADPEPRIVRRLPLSAPLAADVTATLRLDARADDAALDALLGAAGATADRRLTGSVAHRGAAAVDGDPSTAWLTPIDDVVGATLSVHSVSGEVAELVVAQPVGAFSSITEIEVASGADRAVVAVPPSDATGRSTVALPVVLSGDTLSITITAIEPATAVERRYGDLVTLPAGIAELSASPGIDASPVDTDAVVSAACSPDWLTVDGTAVPLSFTTTVGALVAGQPVSATACGAPLVLGPDDHEIVSTGRADTALTVDRVVLDSPATNATTGAAAVAEIDVRRDDARHRSAAVTCPDGCWFVLGEGHNPAWEASIAGSSLGDPRLVDGGFNGWWIEPSPTAQVVDVSWSAQWPVTVGLALSGLAVAACLALLVLGRRRGDEPIVATAEPSVPHPLVVAAALVLSASVLIAPVWAVAALAAIGAWAGTDLLARRTGVTRLALAGRLDVLGIAAYVVVVAGVLFVKRRDQPIPNSGWTPAFESLNGLAIFAVLLVAAGCSAGTSPRWTAGLRRRA